jgi:hypothetical protein
MKLRNKALLMIFISTVFTGTIIAQNQDETEVREAILNGYVNGAFNALDPDEMGNTFHNEFSIFSTDGENLNRYPIATWRENVAARKNDPNFDPAANVWEHSFETVDITGNSAMVKLYLYREGNHVYTDYLSLLKFNDGWKIVAKVYFEHEPG